MYLFAVPTVLVGFLLILSIWFESISDDLFGKIFLTYIVYIVVVGVIYGVQKHLEEEKRQKEKGLIN